jgi:hypothetical protein
MRQSGHMPQGATRIISVFGEMTCSLVSNSSHGALLSVVIEEFYQTTYGSVGLFCLGKSPIWTIQLLPQFGFGHRTSKPDIFDHPTLKTVHNWPSDGFDE